MNKYTVSVYDDKHDYLGEVEIRAENQLRAEKVACLMFSTVDSLFLSVMENNDE